MMPVQKRAQAVLKNLLGLQVSRIFQVGDMTCFVFIGRDSDAASCEWALHVLEGWRLEYGERTLTGTYDHFEYCDPANLPIEGWDPTKGNSYLDRVLRDLLGDRLGSNEAMRDIVNRAQGFVVSGTQVLPNGDCSVSFENGYRIKVLPLAGTGEAWVIFQRGKSEEGFSMYMEDLAVPPPLPVPPGQTP